MKSINYVGLIFCYPPYLKFRMCKYSPQYLFSNTLKNERQKRTHYY
jgi:hypothetical protein